MAIQMGTTRPKPRLNPFAFPSDTDFRFVMLIAATLCASLLIYDFLYNAFPANYKTYSNHLILCIHAAASAFPGSSFNSQAASVNFSAACMVSSYRLLAAWVGLGIALLLSVAGAIYWLLPSLKIRRDGLRPLANHNTPPGMLTYLDALCRQAELRHAPVFLLNPYSSAASGVAFGHFGRYYVVLHAGLIKLYRDDRPFFRAVVLHELAHLRNGDINKTYFTIAIVWYGVVAISSHDVWTVGFYVDEKTRNTLTLTEHWDGTKWSIVTSPNPSTMANNAIDDSLLSLYALATNNVWAVGSFDGLYEPLAEHWDGTKWSVIHSPNPAPNDGNSAFQGIGGSAANDLWAVGDQSNGHYDVSLIEHWNGSKWKVVPNPGTGLPSFNGLYSVSATSATDVWAVGYQQGTTGNYTLIEHWNGQTWRIVPSPKVTLGPATLYGVVASSTTDAWAVGSVSDNGAPLLIEHWNGTRWTLALGLSHQPTGGVAHAAAMVSGKLWVVGQDYNSTSQVLIGYFCS